MHCASVPFICTVVHPLIRIGRSVRTWKWTSLISMVVAAAPVARNRVVLPELEKSLLLLGFFVCDLTLNGVLCYLQRFHRSCRQPLPKRIRGPSASHIVDFKKKKKTKFEPNWQNKWKLMLSAVCRFCLQLTPSQTCRQGTQLQRSRLKFYAS